MTDFGSALILAGGKGKRIGYDKKNIICNGEKLIDTTISKLRTVFSEIIISSNTEFIRDDVLTVADTVGSGPLAGIFAGLTHCTSRYLFVIAVDMPFFSIEYINFLKSEICKKNSNKNEIDACVMRREDGFLEPFNSFFNKSCATVIKTELDNGIYKVLPLLKKLQLHIIEHGTAKAFSDENIDMFFNINYAEDLQRASKI
ncbi:MAG: molybdenum cofactor guanylyltransferase [Termitinemataceae bacterium]|nr:MAG: molybdenum cofactor guanylyltransferase [Termitinemataceae bacterium]